MAMKINRVTAELATSQYRKFLFLKGALAASNNSEAFSKIIDLALPSVQKKIIKERSTKK